MVEFLVQREEGKKEGKACDDALIEFCNLVVCVQGKTWLLMMDRKLISQQILKRNLPPTFFVQQQSICVSFCSLRTLHMRNGQRYEPVAHQEQLGDSLIASPGSLPEVTSAVPLIEIIAPASLPEDYEFSVTMNHQKYMVKVPMGGVEAGQKFSVPMTDMMMQQATVSIPVGHWRDGLMDLFKYGIWHPHWITAVACSLLAAGQVINRLHFTWRGTPSESTAESSRAFNIIFFITLFHWFMIVVMWLALQMLDTNDYVNQTPDEWEDPTGLLLAIEMIFNFFKLLYFVINGWILFQVRKSIRAKYAIPGTDSNDACTTLWCPCLVAGQLLRHTTDYDVHPGRLCTDTGLPETV